MVEQPRGDTPEHSGKNRACTRVRADRGGSRNGNKAGAREVSHISSYVREPLPPCDIAHEKSRRELSAAGLMEQTVIMSRSVSYLQSPSFSLPLSWTALEYV